VSTGIIYHSMSFPLWEAAITAGASLTELEKLDAGGFSVRFQGKLMGWHMLHQLVGLHKQDAAARASEKAAKRKRK